MWYKRIAHSLKEVEIMTKSFMSNVLFLIFRKKKRRK